MDFDQMLEIWRAQNTAAAYEVNRDALRKTLQAEVDRIRREMRLYRRSLWVMWLVGGGMAIWAGFWIAITITNGWSMVYVATSAASVGLFVLGLAGVWASRAPREERRKDFGNTLQEEVKRNLALVDHQLSQAGRSMFLIPGTVSIMVGVGLFSWTVNASQEIAELSSGRGWSLFTVILVGLLAWAFHKERGELRKTKPKLELRRERLHELLETLAAGD
jgi:hypothetical protein